MADKTEKKKPGRPPKKKDIPQPAEIRGIVNEPTSDQHIVELIFANPMMFHKIGGMLKNFTANEIDMRFGENGLEMVTKDHLKKSDIYIDIDGRCMTKYYCKQPISICIKHDSLNKVLSTITCKNTRISFVLKDNYRSTLYAMITDTTCTNIDSYEIDVITRTEDIRPVRLSDHDYPLSFSLPYSHLKTKIDNIRKHSQTFTIQKTGEANLQFTCDNKDTQKVNWICIYSDDAKINLKSNLAADEVLNVSVYIEHITPFTRSKLGGQVMMAVDKLAPISISTELGECEYGSAARIKIFTEIKDYSKAMMTFDD